MELKEYVKETLLSIVQGVKEANELCENRFKLIGDRHNETGNEGVNVNFDVSVIVNNSKQNNIEGGVKTPFLQVIDINFSADKNNTSQHTNSHRLQFKVFVTEVPSPEDFSAKNESTYIKFNNHDPVIG